MKKKRFKTLYEVYRLDNVYFIEDIITMRNYGYSKEDLEDILTDICNMWDNASEEKRKEFLREEFTDEPK